MKMKKLLSLMLCIVMLATTVLTSCEKEKTEEEKAAENNIELVTLNMFIVTDDETTEEQKQSVEVAINEITIKSFKTKLNINFLKEDEYWPAIEKTIQDVEAYDEQRKKASKDKKETSKKNSLSLDQIYTDMRKNGINLDENVPQIDIIVFNDFTKYYEFVNPGTDEKGKKLPSKLVSLDSYLKEESKILTSYIYPSYFDAAKAGGTSVYGIPTNGPIGTFEYIAIDRELAEKYIKGGNLLGKSSFATEEEYNQYFDNYVAENYNTFPKLASFLAAVKAGETDIVPLNKGTYPSNVEFYLEEGSPIGVVFEGYEWQDRIYSIYADPSVREHFETIYNFRQAGYLADENTPEDARYAVQIIEGSPLAEQVYEEADGRDYIFITYKHPTLMSQDVLSGVFSISEKSRNKDRAMEIIEAFNTREELANLLQWGVEYGKTTYTPEGALEPVEGNYRLDDDKTVVLIDGGNGYKMNNNHTGNKYIKYRLSGTPDEFEGQKLQNTMSWIGAFAGYNPTYYPEDKEADTQIKEEIRSIIRLANEYYPDFVAGTGDRPFDERYDELLTRLESTNPLLAFDTHVWYNYSGPYVTFVAAMKELYPHGRVAQMEETVEEEAIEEQTTEAAE